MKNILKQQKNVQKKQVWRGNVKEFIRNSNVNSVKIEKVIIVKSVIGKGTKEDLSREITEIYDLKGRLIARIDPCKE